MGAWSSSGKGKQPHPTARSRKPATSMSWVCGCSSALIKLIRKLLPWQANLPVMSTKQNNCKKRCYTLAQECASARAWKACLWKAVAVVTIIQVEAAATTTIYDMNAESTLQKNVFHGVLILQEGAG